jgi:hypothetical protein
MFLPAELNGSRKGESIDDYRLRYLRSIPLEIRQQMCQCQHSVQLWHKTQATSPNGLVFNWEGKVAVHWDCNKPMPNWTYIETCFNCEQLYIIKTFPDKMMLCEDCGG